MLSNGIKLYEYLPSMLHIKACVIDGQVSTLGTYNLDYRSWYHNLEIVAIIHDTAVARYLEDMLLSEMEQNCEAVCPIVWSSRPWLNRLVENFFWLFRRQM